MPHDSHTTHEPDRVGREGEFQIPQGEDLSREPTLLMFGGFDPLHRADELAPATN